MTGSSALQAEIDRTKADKAKKGDHDGRCQCPVQVLTSVHTVLYRCTAAGVYRTNGPALYRMAYSIGGMG